jgi:hypothetical protein
MPEYNRQQKKQLGALLLKLSKGDFGLRSEEVLLAKALKGRGLVKWSGEERRARVTSGAQAALDAYADAFSHYDLSDSGQAFVQRHSEDQLREGRFLFPGETPWQDEWPWKLLWPALVSIATSAITAVITTLIVSALKQK